MRWEEIGWTRPGQGTLMDVRAGIDSRGNLVAMDFTNTIPSGISQDWSRMLMGEPLPADGRTVQYAPAPMYNLPNSRWMVKSVPATGNWISGNALRGVGSHNVAFAGEQVIDELAHVAKMDPVAFRIQNVVQGNNWPKAQCHDQLLACLNAVTKAANWRPKVAASNLSDANVVTGRGVAWCNVHRPESCPQTAAIADIEVNKNTGKVTVKHVYQALSPGLAVYPGGIANQIVGGTIMGVSWVLVEQMRYSRTRVTSSDFVTYPILRFADAPKVTPIVIQWGGKDSNVPGYASGVGEMVTEHIPAVIANAFFDATGVRMRTAPFTPARVRAALKAAGVA
jgi:CO/xanthine dehydrogenase Mo-binding subunit